MARKITVDLFQDGGTTALVPVDVRMVWTPTRTRDTPAGTVLKKGFTERLQSGSTVLEIDETEPHWAYRVLICSPTNDPYVEYDSRTVQVPAGDPIAFHKLPQIDPKTLDPVVEPEAAWWEAVKHLKGDKGDQGEPGPRGLPGVNAVPAAEAVQTYIAQDDGVRSELFAASAQSIADPDSPVHAAVEAVAQASTPTGVVTSPDFNVFKFSEDVNYDPTSPGEVVFYMPVVESLYNDFTATAVGETPAGWSPEWSTVRPWVVVDDATATGGKALRITGAVDPSFSALRWNDIKSVTTGEMVFKWKTSLDINPGRAIIMASGTETTANGYYAGIRNATTAAMGRLTAGTSTLPLGTEAAHSTVANTWYITRFRKDGDQLMSRTWLATDPEPTTWQVTATDSSHTSGWWGLYSRKTANASINVTITFDWAGYARGAGTAQKGA